MSTSTPANATPRSFAWMEALRDRYLAACTTHPVVGPLDQAQQLERDNADYWTHRLTQRNPKA
ncbi:hypothetical protein PlfCFBP13513_14865 [Plantibacter flavus]|uniref:hypothetical protein n=1 Tax=Plantibacter TaxID=190323 RepID=UPI0010C17109|nr:MULTISPECIES: hypothetical protein [Plantibacter]MBD8103776.1 hypothetical protein [Plantibacter sp. CFBP 8775]MBD8467225.1 hypothetical protein [Plantibacter sp. CFBP 8798]MBD8516372.1 hypothetical protein [Plantibacter sp. CFBP 8804]MBD8535578.1 hypothetical protein [Plantibacter sp. CFBP 13570]TKJ96706.1 hypothetical protein PlfCFBP13513_14865 [Plantibacter flavus]